MRRLQTNVGQQTPSWYSVVKAKRLQYKKLCDYCAMALLLHHNRIAFVFEERGHYCIKTIYLIIWVKRAVQSCFSITAKNIFEKMSKIFGGIERIV